MHHAIRAVLAALVLGAFSFSVLMTKSMTGLHLVPVSAAAKSRARTLCADHRARLASSPLMVTEDGSEWGASCVGAGGKAISIDFAVAP